MQKFKQVFVVLIMLLFISVVHAQGFTVQKLPNGQTLVVYEIHNNPIVTIDTWIKTGSINEDDSNNGISHFLEHLFFKGTKLHPTGEIDRILESKGAIINAATSKDFTHYYITIPSADFDTALELHSDMLLNPQIPRKELEQERKVVIEEISKDGNSPSKKVYDNLNKLMYTTHPYKRKVIGTAENVGVMRREEILEYFNKYYSPSNMVTLVVGDVDTAKTIEKVQNSFNQPYKKPIKKTFRKEHQIQTQRRNVEYTDSQSGYMMIGFRGADINDKNTFALDVLSEILGGGKSSRLYKDIKEQKGLAFSISTSNGSFRDDGILYITANFVPHGYEKLEKAIFENITKIQKYGITEEELQRAKNKIIQDTYYARESTANIATELGYTMALTGSSNLYNNYIEGIKKVSSCDVQSAAQKYLGVNKSAISLILPESMKEQPKQEVKNHTYTKISENKGIAKYQIDNGATLLINENKNNDIIAINIIAKGGEFVEKVSGEGTLMSKLLLKGTKKYSSQELAQILDENGIQRIEEYYPNALEKAYKGVSGYIYSVSNVIESDIDIKIPDTVSTSLAVDVESVEYIEDAYEAILQAEKDGLITIMRYEEMTPQMKEWNIKTIKEEYENAIDHPEYRHFLKGNFPDIFKELIAYCGVDCETCNDYINEVCPSCKATKWDKDNICMPVKCCRDKKIDFCGLCEVFPCKDMKDFYEESKSHQDAYIKMMDIKNNS